MPAHNELNKGQEAIIMARATLFAGLQECVRTKSLTQEQTACFLLALGFQQQCDKLLASSFAETKVRAVDKWTLANMRNALEVLKETSNIWVNQYNELNQILLNLQQN